MSGMGLARLRRDGFVSVDAGPRPGRLLTRPLLFRGERLHVNADCRRGALRAELFEAKRVDSQDPAWNWAIERPLPGFSLAESLGVTGDSTDAVLRWRGDPALDRFAGTPIVIRFELVQGSLYSFWIR
jgi:hypothetical protein